jgi:hypothetical protein
VKDGYVVVEDSESGGGENEGAVVGELKERKGKEGSEGGVVVKWSEVKKRRKRGCVTVWGEDDDVLDVVVNGIEKRREESVESNWRERERWREERERERERERVERESRE